MSLRKNAPLYAITLVLLGLILCPLLMILTEAVAPGGRFDLTHARRVAASAENVRTIVNSLMLGAAVVLFSSLIAAPLAFLLSRTSLARHGWLDLLFLVPFMTPPFISSMGWILFMQRNGLFQQFFPFFGRAGETFFSFWGLALVMSLHVFPFMLIMLKNALLHVGSGFEEAGAIFGAGFWARLRKVTAPLILGNYTIAALLVFVKTLSEYGTPATLGQRIGFQVFTTDIHRYSTTSPIAFDKASALSLVLIVICLGMWLAQNRITARHSYNLVGGKGVRLARRELPPAVLASAWAYVGLVLLLAIGVPYFSVISTSLIKLRGYGFAAGNFTLDHYRDLFLLNPKGRGAILTSASLAAVSATLAALLGTFTALAVRQGRGRLKKAVEGLSLLPEMLPGIVLVIGIMLFWNGIYRLIPLYNTLA